MCEIPNIQHICPALTEKVLIILKCKKKRFCLCQTRFFLLLSIVFYFSAAYYVSHSLLHVIISFIFLLW